MSGLRDYDDWKTTEPDEPDTCPCCNKECAADGTYRCRCVAADRYSD